MLDKRTINKITIIMVKNTVDKTAVNLRKWTYIMGFILTALGIFGTGTYFYSKDQHQIEVNHKIGASNQAHIKELEKSIIRKDARMDAGFHKLFVVISKNEVALSRVETEIKHLSKRQV